MLKYSFELATFISFLKFVGLRSTWMSKLDWPDGEEKRRENKRLKFI